MILAMLRVMALSLVRDRGALAMAFVLPPTIFVIFAAIFSGTSGDGLRLQIVYGATVADPTTARFETAIRAETSLRVRPSTYGSEAALAAEVAAGRADAGLLVRGDLASTGGAAPIMVMVDPGKQMAGPILAGLVQRILATGMADVGVARTAPAIENIVGGFTTQQQARLGATLKAIAANPTGETGDRGLVEQTKVGNPGAAGATVTYYAGAVAILFLLFSAMQGAASLIEERSSGSVDRLAVGPAGTDVVVAGKFLFLTLQGILQVGLIFAVAALAYHVEVLPQILPWAITTALSAAAAAGLGLAVASACSTKQQAQTISTFLVLVFSAIGGSMVPRFLMPPWLQDIGWFTPNAWAIEAYHGVLWRGETLGDLTGSFLPLAGLGIAGLLAALQISRWRLAL